MKLEEHKRWECPERSRKPEDLITILIDLGLIGLGLSVLVALGIWCVLRG